MSTDITICQVCQKNPAVYGDGLTWSRCAKCQLQYMKSKKNEPTEQEPVINPNETGFSHTIKPGLVSVIIPVYINSYTLFHYTGNCIGSLREHTDRSKYELIIVDNGSTIKPPELQSYYADKVIQNEQNTGYTKACNQGIRVSQGEYIVLLSNDVLVFDGWLDTMLKVMQSEQLDLIMASPMYSKTEPFARAIESKRIAHQWEGKPLSATLERVSDFSCVMIKRSLLDEIGLFDEQFLNYCSDIDFLRRMDEKGKKWAICRAVPTSHISSATGFSLTETPDIMNEDKRKFAEKYKDRPVIIADKPKKEGKLIRSQDTGDAIYLVVNGEFHHISDPDTLHALGFEFGQEEVVTSFSGLKYGEAISMKNYQKYV